MKTQGFTLIEILVALAGTVVLALAATNYLFSILSQRDQALAEAMALDQVETVAAFLADRVRSAGAITVGADGKTLGLIGQDQCWLLLVDELNQRLNYAFVSDPACQVPLAADQPFTSSKAQITGAIFALVTSDDSSQTVAFDWTVAVNRPLWQTSQGQRQLFVNVVDGGGQ